MAERKWIAASDVTSRHTRRHIASTESTCVTTQEHKRCSSEPLSAGSATRHQQAGPQPNESPDHEARSATFSALP